MIKWYIVNYQSGNGRGQRAWTKIKQKLDIANNNIFFLIKEQEKAESLYAKLKVAQLEHPASEVTVIGGDGTIHHVLNALLKLYKDDLSHIPLINIVAAGSGNDLARALPKNSATSIDILEIKYPGQENDHQYGFSVASSGFDSQVAKSFNSLTIKPLLNRLNLSKLAYQLTIISTVLRYKPRNMTIELDGNILTFEKVWLIAAANSAYYGCGIPIVPGANYTDQKLELCIIHGCSLLQFPNLFIKVINGRHTNNKYVTMLTGKDLKINSEDNSMIVQVDGEPLGSLPATISIAPFSMLVKVIE